MSLTCELIDLKCWSERKGEKAKVWNVLSDGSEYDKRQKRVDEVHDWKRIVKFSDDF